MSVLLETSAGDIVIDLLVDYAPRMCENFLKLCKVKYYNFSPIHSVQKSFSFQTGDPLGPRAPHSDGGTSIWGYLSGEPADKTFPALFHPKLRHVERGTVSMATVPHPSDPDQRLAGSQFLVTLGDNTDYLDGKAAIFGKVVEGFDVLEKINDAIVDERGYPLVDIRIKHTVVLDDPYPDPAGLREPSSSPPPTAGQLATVRIGEDEELLDEEANEEAAAEAERRRKEREAAAQALTLEMMGDLPFAEVKPPENVLFVCKLNPVTTDEDLELIFSRFGKILSCEVIRDQKTGDSLQYAFIEFEDRKSCEDAYSKMESVLIDDRRIHVDFSQSVSRLSEVWRNETNTKRKSAARRGGGGGWGGVKELEKRRQYRNEDVEPYDDDEYRMVHGVEDLRGRHGRNNDSAGPTTGDGGRVGAAGAPGETGTKTIVTAGSHPPGKPGMTGIGPAGIDEILIAIENLTGAELTKLIGAIGAVIGLGPHRLLPSRLSTDQRVFTPHYLCHPTPMHVSRNPLRGPPSCVGAEKRDLV
ncbi:peptidyl-prolyl cis-trans isomerase-like 4 [Dichotomopilus funicola]|uniref:Peptidyl-prolyl cis-trans isomerase n=1 Tax=Dichotomopilus funicola TaxID=1934379 RepID=A0AAN6UVS1_9PEZI|nr:peptidyl-prolyl cis-trans isomerase-like 4 [Dichotomopilus funicola]